MNQFSRKGPTSSPGRDITGQLQQIAVRNNSKMARIARHRKRQLAKAQRDRVRQYKQQLQTARKRFPVEERTKLRLEDL